MEEEPPTPRKRNTAIYIDENNDADYAKLQSLRKKSKSGKDWEEMFAALLEYKKENGDANVPYFYPSNRALGYWCHENRKYRELIPKQRREKLDSIGFDWLSTQDRIWESKFQRVKAYFEKNGTCLVPNGYNDGQGFDLHNWIVKQKQVHAQGRMSQERFEKLESVGFVWRTKEQVNRDTSRDDRKWLEKYERLKVFQKQFGTTAVPFQYPKDKSLGRWVNEMRTQNTRGCLREDRKELLNGLGFIWRINRSVSSNGSTTNTTGKRIKLAPRSGSSNDDTASTTEEHDKLAIVSPSSSETDSSPDARKNKVNDAGEIRPHGVSFDRMMLRLTNFKKQYGHVNPSPDYVGLGLGPWVMSLKQQARAGKLDERKARRLRAIGFVGDGQEQIWNEKYRQLRRFHAMYGHTQVSKLEDAELSGWVGTQQSLLKQGKLREDRKAKLAVIGFLSDMDQFDHVAAQLHAEDQMSDEVPHGSSGLAACASHWH